MKIVIAPDSYKESLTAYEVAKTIHQAFLQHLPDAEYHLGPMADGGEGTASLLAEACGGEMITIMVQNPLGESVEAQYGLFGDTAVIEMAQASGLHLVKPSQRNPDITCSYGTGELIAHALDQDVSKVIVGLGGSATNDAGLGMLMALGAKFFDKQGDALKRGGASLSKLASIDTTNLHPKIKNVSWQIACDVDNPLVGPNGASAIFGPQKGATSKQVSHLDDALKHFATKIEQHIGINVSDTPGAGAAGGLGAAFLAFMKGQLKPGIDIVADTLKLSEACLDANIVITGEGRMDGQSLSGKTPVGVARIAKAANAKQVLAIVGSIEEGYEKVYLHNIDVIFNCIPKLEPLDRVLKNGARNLTITSDSIARLIKGIIAG
ncbi:glycerate kinase [Reinekea forsetii]|nr:glycerate kinase [Reinekea forsetii]